ncbi:hypothetical protein E3N88_30303 [Mikania micrantha]|uniref:Uncharacterized protein n=1 Tax=Mikania micrantha TaxID=192012 RepID=A0A5N6MLF2_9ASTR|nr:hypothetical protein E3N88_30303 [Mikania micrantha]
MREMVNAGENRARNEVMDCSEAKNEEKFRSIGLVGSSRYAMDRSKNPSRYAKNVTCLSLPDFFAVREDSGGASLRGDVFDIERSERFNLPVDYVSPVEEVLYMYEPVNFGLSVEVSCIYTSLSTSGRQLRCLVLHKPVDFGSTVEANVLCTNYEFDDLPTERTPGIRGLTSWYQSHSLRDPVIPNDWT